MNIVLWRLGIAFFFVWDHLPVLSMRKNRDKLRYQKGYAVSAMWRALDDLETRGDEVAARGRLYEALTSVDWA